MNMFPFTALSLVGGYTHTRHPAEAGEVGLRVLFARAVALGNWTLFNDALYLALLGQCLCRLRSTRKLAFSGGDFREMFPILGMLGSTADASTCVSPRWHLGEFCIFPS